MEKRINKPITTRQVVTHLGIVSSFARAEYPFTNPNVRKRLNKIKDIRRDLDKKQKNHDVEDPMYVNGFYSPLIEMWATGSEWDDIIDQVDMGEGDIVRCFKRVIDVLRQFCTISNIPEDLVFTAREAIELIQKSPIDIE